ncbi:MULTISPECIES: Na+/H+ antiporter subunit E [Roseomonadaceae]|uniref:Na+/H+ antiporter subunit E n=1 Tax=Falsiroseomonas oleicola TaxID=2801474 RepID=A0ABS6HD73_9PROT|nr:Na+/H+ antiporter subunit E [Roseomonas oleicola]MBU8546662.1 Na+/H+ antiporter subunit E [Roseomonas oleicola]
MRRLLPYPLLAAALLVMWLLLNQTVSPGAALVGLALALAAGWVTVLLDVPRGRFRRPRAALRLAWVVMVEIVRSNNAVARIILGRQARQGTSGFVLIPLDMRAPYGLATLACILTATPGTVWVEYDSARSTMLLHVLDLIDEQQWLHIVKDRYEQPLMEIFE